MATIRENKSKGKVVSYQFILFLGRDEQGKQMRKYLTWTPPDGLTPAKQRRAAEQAAKQWEKRIRESCRMEIETPVICNEGKLSCWEGMIAFLSA